MVNMFDPNPIAQGLETLGLRENARLVFARTPEVVLSVREFEVEEGISQLFRVRLVCVSPNEEIDLSGLVGQEAAFELSWLTERKWRGTCQAAEFVRTSETREGLATYELILVPSLWPLTQRIGRRLFQHASIPTIVTAILDEWKVEHEWRIQAAQYPTLELRMQYGESDFAFVSRLLEEAGISFWFVDAGAAASRLVLGDAPHGAEERKGPPIAFVDDVTLAHASRGEFMTNVRLKEQSKPGRFTTRDYDFLRPRYPLFNRADAARNVEHAHEQYLFTPGQNLGEEPAITGQFGPTPVADDLGVSRRREELARQRVQRMLEAMHGDRRVVTYEASASDLSPGVVFRIGRHPRPDLHDDRSFLVVRHHATGKVADPGTWRFAGAAVATAEPFRPPQITPKPRIFGLQTAVVVGPEGAARNIAGVTIAGALSALHAAAVDADLASEALVDNDIYVDEHGRVRVQFAWDREHGFDKRSSIWMRVSQGWAGAGYGLFTIPRVGHEVLIAFLDGDPDNPLIVGRVHNAAEPVPWPLPANKTVSTWKTASSPGGAGSNELRFDDAQGREHVYLQAERDMDHLVKNSLKQAVGGDSTRYAQGHDSAAVGASRADYVNVHEARAVGANQMNFVGMHRTTQVGIEDNTMVGTRWGVTIARGMTSRLVNRLEQIASDVGDVVRSTATTVMGGIPSSPIAQAADSALAAMGSLLFEGLKDALEAVDGYEMDPGPPPTTIEMVDRQIKLSTGEASIVLDGPNVTISAQGNIVLHAMDHVSVLSEKEIAVGGREKVAIVSAASDVILQAKQDLHLNPYSTGGSVPEIERLAPPVPRPIDPEKCAACGGGLHFAENGARSCVAMEGSLPEGRVAVLDAFDASGDDAPSGAEAFLQKARALGVVVQRHGLSGDLLAHVVDLVADALDGGAPSYRRTLGWLRAMHHITDQDYKRLLALTGENLDGFGYVGFVVNWWEPGKEKPASARWTFASGDIANEEVVDRGQVGLFVYLPEGMRVVFYDRMALTALGSLLQTAKVNRNG